MSEDISYFERWKEAHLREPEARAECERELEAIQVEPAATRRLRGKRSGGARIAELEAERDRLRELVKELSELGCDEDLDLLLPLDQVENRGCGKCLPCRARAALYPKEESRG